MTSFSSSFIIFLYCGQKGQLYELLFFQNNELIQQFLLQDENKVIVNNLPSIAVRSCGPSLVLAGGKEGDPVQVDFDNPILASDFGYLGGGGGW